MTTNEFRLMPTGTCWCGCGAEVAFGSFFASGHDRAAEAALLAARYENSIARLIAEHGFGPHNSVRDAAVVSGYWGRCPNGSCDYVGSPTGIRQHVERAHSRIE